MVRYFNPTDIIKYKSEMALESYDIKKAIASDSKDVFLSHSSKDKESLVSIINFLKQYNVNVYLDKEDKELPRKTTSETGEKIKKRIYECKKFIVLVSDNSKESKWIPWELGIADTNKTTENIAFLPLNLNNTKLDWAEQEYMGIYPRITNGILGQRISPVWMVYDHTNKRGTELGAWLKRS